LRGFAAEARVMGVILPETMTPAIDDALGTMNFQTGPIAHLLRATGDDIPTKCEREQSHVLFWMLKLAIEHGENWRGEVGRELKRRTEILKAKETAA
jgi:hypothetical protein